MTYLKSLLVNFLAVFFVNHVIPGVTITYYTKLPHIEGEIIFAIVLGVLNSLVFPVMRFLRLMPSHFKIGLVTFILSFGAYSIINLFPADVKITKPEAYLWCSLIVWFTAYLTNHLEFRQYQKKIEDKLKEENEELEEENEKLEEENEKLKKKKGKKK